MAWLETTDGVRLRYEVVGTGPALVLHLGSGCDSTLWEKAGYLPGLAGIATCVVFDHRGHGASDKPRGWRANTLDRYVQDVIELLDAVGVDRAGFWGYSSGIDVGTRLAERHPDRVSALIGTGGMGPITVEDYTSWARGRAPQVAEGGWDSLIAGFDRQEGHPIAPWMADAIRATDLGQFVDALEALSHETRTYWDELPGITAPTLWIVGEREDPDDESALAVAAMRNAREFRVPGVGHIESFFIGEPVLPVVRAFLTEAWGEQV